MKLVKSYILQRHVPEPFAANDAGNNLKEGIGGGLGGQERWSMGDRMDQKQDLVMSAFLKRR